jgi:hypothetical protein
MLPQPDQAEIEAFSEVTPDRSSEGDGEAHTTAGGLEAHTSEGMERWRSWASSSRLPPKLAPWFIRAEQAALSVIAAELQKRGPYSLTIGHTAALARECQTSGRSAQRGAVALGFMDQPLPARAFSRIAESVVAGEMVSGSMRQCSTAGWPEARARSSAGAKSSVRSTRSPCAP